MPFHVENARLHIIVLGYGAEGLSMGYGAEGLSRGYGLRWLKLSIMSMGYGSILQKKNSPVWSKGVRELEKPKYGAFFYNF